MGVPVTTSAADTPGWNALWRHQGYGPEAIDKITAAVGRLFFPKNLHDTWGVDLLLQGYVPCTGLTAIAHLVTWLLEADSRADVVQLPSGDRPFPLQHIDVAASCAWICDDELHRLVQHVELPRLRSMAQGGAVTVNRMHQTPIHMPTWPLPGMMLCGHNHTVVAIPLRYHCITVLLKHPIAVEPRLTFALDIFLTEGKALRARAKALYLEAAAQFGAGSVRSWWRLGPHTMSE